MKTLRYAAAVLLLSGISIQSASSQVLWYPANGESSVSLEILKPSFPTESNEWYSESYSLLTGAVFLHARAPVSDRVIVVGDLPIAHLSYTVTYGGGGFSERGTAIGNPYIGIEHASGRTFLTELGVRLPLASSEETFAGWAGMLADFDRFEAFTPERATLVVAGNYLYEGAQGLRARVRLGPSLWLFTGEQQSWGGNSYPDRMDVWLAYSGQVGYATPAAQFGVGFTGRMILTESGGSLGDRTVHHLGISTAYTAGRVQPGLHFRIPLDRELRDALNFVLGLNMSVRLS